MNFIWILVSCLVSGILFAGIAAWLSTRRGNTISDILKSQKFENAEAIRLEIFDKVKLSSTIPIVGLYVVAAIVAIGLPVFSFWQLQQEVQIISLSGQINKDPDKKVYVAPKEMGIEESGLFELPVNYTGRRQTINFESLYYAPLTISISLDKQNNQMTVTFSNAELGEETIRLEPGRWNYPLKQRITLMPIAPPAGETVANLPSEAPRLSADMEDLASPGAPGEAAMLSAPERR